MQEWTRKRLRGTGRVWLSAGFLLAFAIALLGIGKDLRAAAGVAGFALLGAAVVRVIDGVGTAAAQRARDLDETRRVLYIALATVNRQLEGSPETAGTVANALAHHYGRMTIGEAEVVAQRIVDKGKYSETGDIIRAEIKRITELLGEQSAP